MVGSIDTYPGSVTKVADIEKQLSQLWAQVASDDKDAVLRATTMNLVIYTEDPQQAAKLAGQVPETHPGRLILVTIDEKLSDGLHAEPTVVCRADFGRVARNHVCGEQIILTAGRDALDKAANAVQSLLLADHPTYLLWLAELDLSHPLLRTLDELSGGLIVDSATFADAEAGLRLLAQYHESLDFEANVFDINWQRLIPYCVALANMFDPPHDRQALQTIKSVEIYQREFRAAALLFFGWLSDRLQWRTVRDQGEDTWSARAKSGLVSLKLINQDDSSRGLNHVVITTDQHVYTLTYNEADHCISTQADQARNARTAAPLQTRYLLDDILNASGPNTLYERTLAVTALISEESISKHAGIVIVDDVDALDRMAARKIVMIARYAIRQNDRFTWALSGGSTPKALYELLAQPPYRDQIDWSKTHLFWGDERDVPPDHANSNQRMVRESLLSQITIPAGNVHTVPTGTLTAPEAAKQYAEHIRGFFGATGETLPEFDLVLLGMGDDGHTASLFPHTAALNAPGEVIFVANEVPQLQTTRLTLTFDVINNAANIIALVSGANKAEILRKVLHGAYRPDDHPIQRVNPDGGMLTMIADRAAASRLR